jgi:hypothetical protein
MNAINGYTTKHLLPVGDQSPRWRPEVSAEKRKSQYFTNRLTDHHKILNAASYNHQKLDKSLHFRFGRKSKMAAGNEHQNTEIAASRRLLDRSLANFHRNFLAAQNIWKNDLLPVRV